MYRSQYETGLSSGSATAFPGGARDEWERALFAGAYHRSESRDDERPKYGALELIRFADGPWPRFGSCSLVLHPRVKSRSTFTFAGSEQEFASERLATEEHLESVLAPLFEEVANGARASVPWPPHSVPTLGVEDLTIETLRERIVRELPLARPDPAHAPVGRVLDSGIEVQIHGRLDLSRDVERIVADPSFAATSTGELLRRTGEKYSIPLTWHPGFRLDADAVPEGFRGPEIPPLARRIAVQGRVDAAVVGSAEASLRAKPGEWQHLGTPAELLQGLKQLWHVLVQFGGPHAGGSAAIDD